MQPNEIDEILARPLSQELLARDLTRLAYVAKDGTPRTVPIAFTWNGSELVLCTTKNAPKLPSLRHPPAAALTIDTEVHPPKILLIRGRAELDVVDGIPEEYLQMNGSYEMTPEQRVEWEARFDRSTTAWSGSSSHRRGSSSLTSRRPYRPPSRSSCGSGRSVSARKEPWHEVPAAQALSRWAAPRFRPAGDGPVEAAEVDAHVQFMRDFGTRLEQSGELVDVQALAPDGAFVRYDGEDPPPVIDGPFAE